MATDRRRVAAELIQSGVPSREALIRAGFGAGFVAGFAGQAEGFLRKLGLLSAETPAPRATKGAKTAAAPDQAPPTTPKEA